MDKEEEKSDGWNLDPVEAIYVLLIISVILGSLLPALFGYIKSGSVTFFGIPMGELGSSILGIFKYSWLFKILGFSIAGVAAVATFVWNKMADSVLQTVLSGLYPSTGSMAGVSSVVTNRTLSGSVAQNGGMVVVNSNGNSKSAKNKWQKIIDLVESNEESNWRLAIIEADIILDSLLETLQLPGQTIGDKLKAVEPSDFLTLDYAWEAHKARNAVAHKGSEFLLNQREARRVISLYEMVFKEFYLI